MNSQIETKLTNAPKLFGAAEEDDAAEVARMLAAGAQADERSVPGGETPLMRAAARGHEEVVRVLLDAGADACARRTDGFTPLILAVFFGHEAVVRLLVERGADASARTNLGTTAARWAEARGFASMSEVLRAAKAPVARAKAATTADEVELFFKGRGRRDAGREEPDGVSPASEHIAEENSPSKAAGASVRHGGQLPAHPSASTFRFGSFLRSWQGSVGTLLLLTAFGVAVFAFMRGGTVPRGATQPAPSPVAPQAAAQQAPAPPLPTPEPSPAFPTPDAQGIMPVTDQGYPTPSTTGQQPYYITTSPVTPVTSGAPGELSVVSENGAPPAQDAGPAARRSGANDASTPTRGDARNDNASDAAPRAARTPEPEQTRPAPPAPPASQAPPPAPQPTPRAKVIQWPPQ